MHDQLLSAERVLDGLLFSKQVEPKGNKIWASAVLALVIYLENYMMMSQGEVVPSLEQGLKFRNFLYGCSEAHWKNTLLLVLPESIIFGPDCT